MEKTEQLFGELLSFTIKEMELCPWIEDLSFLTILKEAEAEITEIYQAKTSEDRTLELGDLFRDVLLAIFVGQRDLGLASIEEVILQVLQKVRRRKPFIDAGERVSKERAVQLWNMAKTAEKSS
ncbi:MAG: MazG nucleotide pyrophosphohydrolase domain-containing protein [Candidatus Kariarchaeaceae archaeon]|jgi:uncharacterized protein YabN with tetrapyrrole methylase and pyrophosphatase domain